MLARIASIAILSLLSQAEARWVPGQCDVPALAQNPNAAAYMGVWYEMLSEETIRFQLNLQCVTATYSL
jgi:lipocalin